MPWRATSVASFARIPDFLRVQLIASQPHFPAPPSHAHPSSDPRACPRPLAPLPAFYPRKRPPLGDSARPLSSLGFSLASLPALTALPLLSLAAAAMSDIQHFIQQHAYDTKLEKPPAGGKARKKDSKSAFARQRLAAALRPLVPAPACLALSRALCCSVCVLLSSLYRCF